MSGTRIPDGPEKPAGLTRSAGPAKSDVPVNRTAEPKISPSNLPFGESAPGKTAINPGGQTGQAVFAREIFRQTAAALGFPKDPLSVAILAFARFFSLSPDSALLGALRREIIASLKSSSPADTKEKAVLEAEALAAVIARDKGVVLSSEALERYARFLMPPAFTGEKKEPGNENDEMPGRDKDRKYSREEVPGPEELEAIAGEQGKQDSLFDILNHLPGKDGQYWMVFPFKINIRGTELDVFLRILKRGPGSVISRVSSGEDGHLIADIAGPKRKWRCFLEKKAGKLRADIRVYPECSPGVLKHFQLEAERYLGKGAGGFDEVLLKNSEEQPSWAEDLCNECLPSINKEV